MRKTTDIFAPATEAVSAYSRPDVLIEKVINQIGRRRTAAYAVFMEALRPYTLQFFNKNRPFFHKYKLVKRELTLNGKVVTSVPTEYPKDLIQNKDKEQELLETINKNVSALPIYCDGLGAVYEMLWSTLCIEDPFRYFTLITLVDYPQLMKASAMVLHELGFMNDADYQQFDGFYFINCR